MGKRNRKRKQRGGEAPSETGASGAEAASVVEERSPDAEPSGSGDEGGGAWYKGKRGRRVRWTSFGIAMFFVAYGLSNLHVYLDARGDPEVSPGHWLNHYAKVLVAIPIPVTDDQIAITSGLLGALAVGGFGCWYLLRLMWLNPKVSEFLIDTETELQKVSWPSVPELRSSTIAVVIFVAIMSTFLTIVDYLLGGVFDTLIGIEG